MSTEVSDYPFLVLAPFNSKEKVLIKNISGHDIATKTINLSYNPYYTPSDRIGEVKVKKKNEWYQLNENQFYKCIFVWKEDHSGRINTASDWIRVVKSVCKSFMIIVVGATKGEMEYYLEICDDITFISKFNGENILKIQGFLQ